MTLMEAIVKFRERCENNPRFLEMKEALKKEAEQNTDNGSEEQTAE